LHNNKAPKEDRVELAAVTEEAIPIAVTEEATSVAAAVEEGAPAAATEEAASAAATKEAVTIEEKADAVGGKAAEEKKNEAAIEAKTEVSEWTCLKCNATNLGRRTTVYMYIYIYIYIYIRATATLRPCSSSCYFPLNSHLFIAVLFFFLVPCLSDSKGW
jgi:hypothetical protein